MTAGLALCATLAAVDPSPAQVIRGGARTCHEVALTFDLCPVRYGTGYDAPLIDYLIEHKIPATFFASGRWIRKHDAAMKQLLAVPFFEIGTHGQVHAHLTKLDERQQEAEIVGPVNLLKARYGIRAPLFRPPYGEFNDTTIAVAKHLGLRLILYSVVSGDPDPALSADRILTYLTTYTHGGSLIVMHANGKGVHTREIVERLTQESLPKKGLTPVTVTELLSCAPKAKP
jgi:peptidoglycan/xylan/chitin deacetylase (PgdA/CDA1 family)